MPKTQSKTSTDKSIEKSNEKEQQMGLPKSNTLMYAFIIGLIAYFFIADAPFGLSFSSYSLTNKVAEPLGAKTQEDGKHATTFGSLAHMVVVVLIVFFVLGHLMSRQSAAVLEYLDKEKDSDVPKKSHEKHASSSTKRIDQSRASVDN